MGIFGKKKDDGGARLDGLALAYISDGVMILGADGTVRLINPAMQKIIGQESERVMGVSFLSVVRLVDYTGKAVPEELNPVRIALRSRQERVERNMSILPHGGDKAIPVELTIRLAPEGSGILTVRNITAEIKEDEAKSDFISTASHEMRTPVASIEGFLALAINPQTATIDDRARGYLTEAHTAAQHLGELFRDLLDTTRLEDGRMPCSMKPLDIVVVLREICSAMEPLARMKNLSYVFDSGEIEGSRTVAPVLYAMADMEFLREIMGNLIDNAVKYTKEGEIRVSVRGEEAAVLVGVADDGMGIGPADLPHIFQKFYRADNSDTRLIGGTGLGLFLVKQRVEAMGGRIWAESKPTEGSQFWFSLPRLSPTEYERRKLAMENAGKMIK